MPGREGATERRRFRLIAAAGASFQGGTAAVDSATVVASLVFYLTGSVFAVGAVTTILRLGWLLPQLVVGYLAQRADRRMPFYVFGAYGRATCLALIAVLLWWGSDWPLLDWPPVPLVVGFFVLWTAYAFISGVVAVPYNDIVGRSIPSTSRSSMLAWRFFGGGLIALIIAVFVRWSLDVIPILMAYALIFGVASMLMILSSSLFVSAGEPPVSPKAQKPAGNIRDFLRGGVEILKSDSRFRLFVGFQWLGGATLMALPFYFVAASQNDVAAADVGVLLGAQTIGSLTSNPLWGRIGDKTGKLRLLQAVAIVRTIPPLLVLVFLAADASLPAFAAIFFMVGAMMNGVTIGYLGYLMEISPDDRRPVYSAYFNVMASPAALLPLLGAALVSMISIEAVFVAAILAAVWQMALLRRIGEVEKLIQ
ncbi:MAG: MFS transporter [Rhodobacteraceae bacterium]|nr:MFS transporter [Paracoccaceae bacterium]